MKKNTGSALIDYIIPTALIGLVCGVSLYYMISDGKILNFLSASSDMEVKIADQMGIMGDRKVDKNAALNNLTGGSFGGSPDNPVEKCTDGTCIIDYGEFILSGIPEDFSSFVQTAGVSGGTDGLISLAKQIADQLEQDGKMNESLEIRKFATVGHNIATLEKEYEKIFNACNKDKTCVSDSLLGNVDKPADFDETFYPYTMTTYDDLRYQIVVGQMREKYIDNPPAYESSFNNNYPSALFVDKYDSLMNSTNISDTTKGVLQELYWEIGKLSDDVEAGVHFLDHPGLEGYGKDYVDAITGLGVDSNPDLPDDPFEIFSGYKPSSLTHVDSALICAAGYNQDTGTKCH